MVDLKSLNSIWPTFRLLIKDISLAWSRAPSGMNRVKTVSDLAFHYFPILGLDVFPHLFFHLFALVGG
jgi:hypothetical protein